MGSVIMTSLYCLLNFCNLMLTMTDCCSGKLGMVKQKFSEERIPDMEGNKDHDSFCWYDKNVQLLLNLLARTCGLATVLRCLATMSNVFHNQCCPELLKVKSCSKYS